MTRHETTLHGRWKAGHYDIEDGDGEVSRAWRRGVIAGATAMAITCVITVAVVSALISGLEREVVPGIAPEVSR